MKRRGLWVEPCVRCGVDRWASTVTAGEPCFHCVRGELAARRRTDAAVNEAEGEA